MFVTQTVRDATSLKNLLDSLRKVTPFAQALAVTTLPRGGLQLAQPAKLPPAVLRAYSQGFDAEDRLSWQSIVRRKPVGLNDAWSREELLSSPYWREFMQPLELTHSVALPLSAPLFHGFPGSVHLLRTEEQGAFSSSQIHAAYAVIKAFDERVASARARHKGGRSGPETAYSSDRPTVHLGVVDAKLRPLIGAEGWSQLDSYLREQMVEQARRRMHQVNSHSFTADRVQFPDTNGNVWHYRVVTYRSFKALGDGPFAFFCLQPSCGEWLGIKAADFQADTELARIIPALSYMAQKFRKGPTLGEIAKVAKLSPFHFHRRFTELLGLTPKQFMLECQIHEAKTDLISGRKELADIARDCGFAHQSHFTSRFKQAAGLTPTRWRRGLSDRQKASDE